MQKTLDEHIKEMLWSPWVNVKYKDWLSPARQAIAIADSGRYCWNDLSSGFELLDETVRGMPLDITEAVRRSGVLVTDEGVVEHVGVKIKRGDGGKDLLGLDSQQLSVFRPPILTTVSAVIDAFALIPYLSPVWLEGDD